MSKFEGLTKAFQPDYKNFIDTVLRKKTPDRVHFIELIHDSELVEVLVERFEILPQGDPSDVEYIRQRNVAIHRFCGLDYVSAALDVALTYHSLTTEDTAQLARSGGRTFQNEHTGPIMSWEDFERYAWPDPTAAHVTASLEWLHENVPEDMCIIGSMTAHICEELTFLMGYESFCVALCEQPDLVEAISKKLLEFYTICVQRYLEYDRVKIIWATDDMGYKNGLLFAPDDMRSLVLSVHKTLAEIAHAAGRAYILHSCGNLSDIMDDLVHDVKIDGKHSFEDTIESIVDAKDTYGRHIALLGGIDVDFLCRADESAIRERVRNTIDACQPGGGFCLGTGNTVANYIPVENYLIMLDEGRLYCGG
jgi:uroporphyrinogen decarboxylase